MMHRRITTAAVEDFAIHTPRDEVDVVRDEDVVYTRGVLTHAAGATTTKILLQVSFLLMKVVHVIFYASPIRFIYMYAAHNL